jgi:alkylation response protein AidB-like acyl-CoA dehydrogenase/acyl-CoA synthetase (AMP-forming)/AMP-acid ligase II
VPLLEGKIRSGFAMTEPGVASSDATNIEARIERAVGKDGDEYIINGRKWWTSGAPDPRCKILIFMGKTDPDNPSRHNQQSMVLVPMDTPGVKLVRPLTVFGYDHAPHGHGEMLFENVRVPVSNILLGEGRGFEIAQGRLGPGRIHHCMRLIGVAERALELMCKRALNRVAFHKPVADQGVTRERIANARMLIDQARLLTLNAAWKMDTVGNKVAKQEIAMIKVVAPNMACQVIDWAMQVHGGDAGVCDDFPLADAYANSRTLRFADGPDEVHRNAIAKQELGRYLYLEGGREKGEGWCGSGFTLPPSPFPLLPSPFPLPPSLFPIKMSTRHFAHWPKGLPRHMTIPETDLFYNVEVSARRYPAKPFLVFYDTQISYAEFKDEAERIAGWLQAQGVNKGDRVLLYMQNSPQFVLAYYGILRANAVVVPVNPMNMTTELRHYVRDAGARVAIVAQDILPQMQPLLGGGPDQGLQQILVATYSDYLKAPTEIKVPDFVKAPRQSFADAGVTPWCDMLAANARPGPIEVGPDDLCVMPYTSGTTGHPKGCMHTHRTVMHTLMAGYQWFGIQQDAVYLAVLPFFHVTGMQGSMSGPLQSGATVVLLPRWDREAAAQCIARYGVTSWTAIPTMIIDFLMNPNLGNYDLSSITRMSGGGAAMPEAIAQKLLDMGITYVEGYGLSETIAPSHINPPDRGKEAVPRHSDLRRRIHGGRPQRLQGTAVRRSRRNPHPRAAGVQGLLEQPGSHAQCLRRTRRQAAGSAPATWPTSMRTATSSWSTASSA